MTQHPALESSIHTKRRQKNDTIRMLPFRHVDSGQFRDSCQRIFHHRTTVLCRNKGEEEDKIVSAEKRVFIPGVPDGTFKLTSVTKSSLSMSRNMSLENHIDVTIFS